MKRILRIDNPKNFDSELNLIANLEKLNKAEAIIKKDDLFSSRGLISKVGKDILIELDNNDLMPLMNNNQSINGVNAESNGITFTLDSFSIKSNDSNIGDEGFFFKTVCVSNIIKKDFDSSRSIYKCFIKTDLSKLNTFFHQFEKVTYQNNNKNLLYQCIRVEINIGVFDITQIKLKDYGFFIIESKQEIDFKVFEDASFAIKQALGFISSYMPGGEEFFFDKQLGFKFVNYMRPAINSMYTPIDWVPYRFLSEKPDIAKMFEGKLNVLPLTIFSNLVSKIYDIKELSSSIIVLLEASSVRSYLLIPSVFAVIIESLSKIISVCEAGRQLPIDDSTLAQKIIIEFQSIINLHADEISPEGAIKINRRIKELNKPIIKEHLTNNEKLTLPFEQLGIILTMDDINAIEHRNDLLHGNILLLDGKSKSESEMNNYMAYVSAKLYTLISVLILKYAGYDGYIINHAKFHELACGIETTEDYYRLI